MNEIMKNSFSFFVFVIAAASGCPALVSCSGGTPEEDYGTDGEPDLIPDGVDVADDAGDADDGEGDVEEEEELPPCQGVPLLADGVLDLDIRAVHVSGSVLLNGGPLPDETASRGGIVFSDQAMGTTFNLPLGQVGAVAYAIVLPPGTYDVTFSGNPELCAAPAAGLMPCNGGPILQAIPLTADGVLDINIPVVHVSGNVLLNGAPLPDETQDRGSLAFSPAGEGGGGGLSKGLGAAGPVSYSIALFPGTYSVEFSANSGLCMGMTAPRMPCSGGPLLQDIGLTADGVLDVNIPAVYVSGSVLLGGAPLPDGTNERGSLSFSSEGGGASTRSFGMTGPFSYQMALMAGTYSVEYSATPGLCSGDVPPAMPCNGGAVLQDIQLTSDGVLDVNIQAVHVSGSVLLNGAPLPNETGDRGSLTFSPEEGESVSTKSLGAAGPVMYQLTLFPGTYTVEYSANSSLCGGAVPPAMPCNGGPMTGAIPLTTDGILDVNIPAVHISGSVLLNGMTLPDETADRGSLSFSMDGGGGAAPRAFGPTGAVFYQLTLLPGTYSVELSANSGLCQTGSMPQSPCNGGTLLEDISLTADGVLDVSIPAVHVTGNIYLGSGIVPDEAGDRGSLSFSSEQAGSVETRSFGPSGFVSYGLSLIPGTYSVGYVSNPGLCSGGATPRVPCNGGTILPSMPLTADGALDVYIPVVYVSGSVLLNGAAMPAETGDRGSLSFARVDGGSASTPAFGPAGPVSYSLSLMPGSYIVFHASNPDLCSPGSTPSMPCADQVLAGCP